MKLPPRILNTASKRDNRNRLADGWAWDNAVVRKRRKNERSTLRRLVLYDWCLYIVLKSEILWLQRKKGMSGIIKTNMAD